MIELEILFQIGQLLINTKNLHKWSKSVTPLLIPHAINSRTDLFNLGYVYLDARKYTYFKWYHPTQNETFGWELL